MLARLWSLVLVAMVAGCPAPSAEYTTCITSDECPDRGLCVDGSCEPCDFSLPEPNDPCLPRCGNERGVGQPCSVGGGECNEHLNLSGGAGICTVDFVPGAELHMCTRPCADDVDCGLDAICQGDPEDPDGDKGCVPVSCASE